MKRNTNADIAIILLEKRIIDEEYAKATLEKQTKLENMRECRFTFGSYKNGGIL